ncbi:MAG: hypothetical protein BWY63_02230 [Chloroflexi bacterium ADurb.Bin360]|nr:MAG: hypothetical protein BWY63_02230 [Chloroflexi bacterium ADurb.Bin360]
MQIEERLPYRRPTFQPGGSACQHQFRLDVEFLGQLALPLFGQMRRTEHRQPLHLAAIQQLAGDQPRLDGLADADVVGDEQAHGIEAQRH